MRLQLVAMAAAVMSAVSGSAQTIPDRPIKRTEITAAAKRQFVALDANSDGVVTRAEFDRFRASPAGRVAAETTDPFKHIGGHWFEKADTSNSGRVTFDMAQRRPLQLFDQFDLNHDGIIGLDEVKLARALLSMTTK